jgi:hypothetical protein
MSSDKREDILARLEAILVATADAGVHVYRDRAELEEAELPAYVLLDGSEMKGHHEQRQARPNIMLLTPQIFYVPVPPTNQLNEGIGPQLSAHRIKLIKAVMHDGQLTDLIGPTGTSSIAAWKPTCRQVRR